MSPRPNALSPELRPLPRSFFESDPRSVAKGLLGKVLVRDADPRRTELRRSGRIVEVEAYLGQGDAAAHAAAGTTPRNSVIFGPPGHAYVYFIYGNHYCLNVSCEPEGKAGCVLFRALEPLSGVEEMARRRGIAIASPAGRRNLTSGPGRLSQAFNITRARDNGRDMTSPDSGLWIGDDGFHVHHVEETPRIGITKAPDALLRYIVENNAFVTRAKATRITEKGRRPGYLT